MSSPILTALSRLANPLRWLGGLVGLAWKRLWHHPGLTLLALLGIVLSVGLVSNASFFAQAVDLVILRQELAALSQRTGRPPFSMRIYLFPSARKPVSLQTAENVGRHIAATLSAEVGLPLRHQGLHIESGSLLLLPAPDDPRYANATGTHLSSTSLVYIANVAPQMEIIAGDPLDDSPSQGKLDVWMHAYLAEKMGVRPGEEFALQIAFGQAPLPIRVRGVWRARDARDPFWFSDPDIVLREMLLVRRADYLASVQPLIPGQTKFVAWHVILDEQHILPAKARAYARGIERGLAVISQYAPGVKLDVSPLEPLTQFVQRQTTLTTTLLSFNLPAFGFLLYFLMLISAILTHWQRRETAILVSRGIGIAGVVGMTLVEELLLFLVGAPLGIGLGMALARAMGHTASFLTFTQRPPLPVSLNGFNLPLTAAALAIALFSRLWPAAQAARRSVIEHEREHARPARGPFWHRYYIDLLLVAPALYAYRQLDRQGTLALLVRDRPEDLYRDPLLVLTPALFIVTASLLTMRLFPLFMLLLDRLATLTNWVTPHLALRQLGRQSQEYVNPLLLIIVCLALGSYTLSLAASLDQWLIDRIYYGAGADLTFLPTLERQDRSEDELPGADWIPLPSEFRALPGVLAVARVGDYKVQLSLGQDRPLIARFLAVDRLEFPAVAWFRADFAAEPLGALMNALAAAPEGILVSERFLDENQLHVGDKLTATVELDEGIYVFSEFLIVGTYRHFPTVYEDRTAVIGNLEHLFSFYGATFPHRIWMRLQPEADGRTVLQAVSDLGIEAGAPRDTRALIREEQGKMERAGVFGALSLGFLASAAMAALGLLVHSYASLRDRLYRFAVLRAVGIERRQVIGQIALEYAALIAYGVAVGIGIGGVAAQRLAPYFRIAAGQKAPLPPLIPIVDYDRMATLAIAFAATMIALEIVIIAIGLYRRLFEMMRLGSQG